MDSQKGLDRIMLLLWFVRSRFSTEKIKEVGRKEDEMIGHIKRRQQIYNQKSYQINTDGLISGSAVADHKLHSMLPDGQFF